MHARNYDDIPLGLRLNMSPRFTKMDTTNSSLINSKSVCDFLLGYAFFKHLSNLWNIFFFQSGVRVFAPLWDSSLCGSVPHIIKVVPQKEMRGIHASPNVAPMADMKFSGEWAVSKKKGNSVCSRGPSVNVKCSVAVVDFIGSPNPAIIRSSNFYLIPKPSLVFLGEGWDWLCSIIHTHIMGFVRAVSVLNTSLRLARFYGDYAGEAQA